MPVLDDAFAGLLTDLKQRGMLDETLVVSLTAYGRTPKTNNKADRHPWFAACSFASAGAGIKAGQVIGASDRLDADGKDSPVTPEQIATAILQRVGISSPTEFIRSDGQRTMLAEPSEPVRGLLR